MERKFRVHLPVRASRPANRRHLLFDDRIRVEAQKDPCDFVLMPPTSIIPGQEGVTPC
jgi:hypothetical protein